MKRTRLLMAALMAAVMFAACGQQAAVSTPESSAAPESNGIESASSEESVPEDTSSDDAEDGIVHYPVTAAQADGINNPELVCLLLPAGEYIQQVFETEDGNYLLSVQAMEGVNCLRLVSGDGELLKEVQMRQSPYMGWVFQQESGFVYDGTKEDGSDFKLYYDQQLNEQEPPEENASFAYSLDYSEDGKYLQLVGPDGSRKNLAKTGAESYEEILDGAGFYSGRAGRWESYSSGGPVSGIVNLETGETYTFTEESGISIVKDMGEYIICTSQGLEGGRYPSEPFVYQFYPENGELKGLALPYQSWPELSQGTYFAYDLYFGYDGEGDARSKAELMALAPGLTEEELDTDSVMFVVDAKSLQVVR